MNPVDATTGIYAMRSSEYEHHRNVAFMTTITPRGPLTRDERLTTVAHELGHLFSALHDHPNDPYCSPETPDELFIMHPYSIEGDRANNKKFSECSKYFIRRLLKRRWGLLTVEKFQSCGNGIVEDGEECDCGAQEICHIVDPCCNSQCKIKGECSPLHSRCCNAECKIEQAGKKCSLENDCQKASYCDGKSSECPKQKSKPDGKLCASGLKACKNGRCSGSICIRYDLTACACPSNYSPCLVCCLNETCQPLKTKVFKPYGSRCDYQDGHCNLENMCVPLPINYDVVQSNDSQTIFQKYSFLNNWFYIIFLLTMLVLSVFSYLTSKQGDSHDFQGLQPRNLSFKQLSENNNWTLYIHQKLDEQLSEMNRFFEMFDEYCRSFLPFKKQTALERLKIFFPNVDDELLKDRICNCEMERDTIEELLFKDKFDILEGWVKYETYIIIKSDDVDLDKRCLKNAENFCYARNLNARRNAVKKYRAETILNLRTLFSFESGKSRYFKLPIERLRDLCV